MKNPDLAFRSLSVRQMPGFEDGGFRFDDLEPCINIITGRNASGKTTTARALCLLLWPSDEHDWNTREADVAGTVVLNEVEWTLEVHRGQVRYVRDGMAVDRFPAPAEQTRDRYNLALHELIQSDDEAFAERIMRESAGGYDLDAAAKRLAYSDGVKTRGVAEYRAYQESRKRLQDVRREQERLKEDERRLDDLKRRRREAREAERRMELLDLALSFKAAEKELAACVAALEEYPEGITKASGEEYDRLQSLNEAIDDAEARVEAALRKKESARGTMETLSIPADGIEDAVLDALTEHVETIKELERDISQRREELEGYRSEAQQIIQDVHPELQMEDWLTVDLDAVSQLDRLAQQGEAVRAREEALGVVHNWLRPSGNYPDTEELHTAMSTLRAWLREAGVRPSSGVSIGWAIAAALTAVLAGLSTYVVGPIGWVFLIIPGAVLVYAWYTASGPDGRSRAEMRRADYRKMDLEQPEEWTVEGVESVLANLSQKYAEAKVDEERRQQLQAFQEKREDLNLRREQLEHDRAELEDRVGPVPFVDGDPPLAQFLQKVRQFQQKVTRMKGIEGRIAALEDQISESVESVNREIHSFWDSNVSDPREAREVVRSIEREHRKWKEASRSLEEACEAERRARDVLADKSSERIDIFEKLGIEEGRIDQVRELMKQVEPYDEARKKEFSARDRRNEARRALKDHELFTVDITERDREQLERQLDSCRTAADRLDDIVQEINRIETLVEKQQNQHDLEEALAARDRCLESLEDLREENLRSLVGQTLVDTIKEKTRYQSRPAVFRRADQLFSRITSGRYQLDLDSSSGVAFRARDTQQDAAYSLDELSSGTKIQLLLAVRMAFVESQEQTVKFPLFVDEVLANSDDVRARAIIDALVEICEDGRQIFYFTAQSDEVHRWRQALEEREVAYSVRSLSKADVVTTSDYASNNGVSVDLVHAVARPDGQSHAAYGETLSVPPFHPLVDPVDKLHLWYLIEDTALLYTCLARGIDTWGPLTTYLESGGRLPGCDTEVVERLEEQAQVLEEVLELYRRGRPKPVPPRALHRTNAVTDNFIEEVTELLDEVDGDPERLLQGLREGAISGFRTAKMEELETYFEDRGYIDGEEALSEAELQIQMKAIVSRRPGVDDRAAERLLERVLGTCTGFRGET